MSPKSWIFRRGCPANPHPTLSPWERGEAYHDDSLFPDPAIAYNPENILLSFAHLFIINPPFKYPTLYP